MCPTMTVSLLKHNKRGIKSLRAAPEKMHLEMTTKQVVIRVRPIPVSGIGRYSPVTVGIGIGRYLFEHRHQYQ